MSLELVLLGLLRISPSTGYQLKQRIDSELDPLWRSELPQIYPALSKLKTAGFVAMKVLGPNRGPGSLRYRLTPRGRKELERWLAEPPRPPDLRDESMVRLLFAGLRSGRATAGMASAWQTYEEVLADEMLRLRQKRVESPLGEAVRGAALAHIDSVRRWARSRREKEKAPEKEAPGLFGRPPRPISS
jgi:DNA-binding PadR family transcriptional regulator